MSWQEYQLHFADYLIAPYGERRADYRIAFGFSRLANALRGNERNPSPFSFKDFLIPLDVPFEEVEKADEDFEDFEDSEEEIITNVNQLADFYGWKWKKQEA